MPEPLEGIVLRAVWRQMLEFQPSHFGHTCLDFLTLMDTTIIPYEHQNLLRKILMEWMQEGNAGAGIALGRLLPINPLTLKV
jgi:hypothetical protein